MKSKTQLGIGISAVLFLSMTAFGKDKHPEAPVYDHTATVSYVSFHYDSSASITVNGETTSAYCSTSGTSVDCSDRGGAFVITADDGRTLSAVSLADENFSTIDGKRFGPLDFVAHDPLSAVETKVGASFQFRLETVTKAPKLSVIVVGDTLMCLPISFTDKKGKAHTGDACYKTLVFDKQTAVELAGQTPIKLDAVSDTALLVRQLNDLYQRLDSTTTATADGTVLTIHSEKCSAEKFAALVDNSAAMVKAGFTTLVYTNGRDLKFTRDFQSAGHDE